MTVSTSIATHVRIPREYSEETLHGCLRHPNSGVNLRIVAVFVHGFIGDGVENHRLFVRLGRRLNDVGITTLLFDQYGCGYSDGTYPEVDLGTCSSDIKAVTEWATREFSDHRIALVGQSLGSALCLDLEAQLPQMAFRVLFNPAARFDDWLLERFSWNLDESEDDFCALPKGVYVSRSFVRELLSWDWCRRVGRSSIPTLLVASEADETGALVTVGDVARRLGEATELLVLSGANHSLIGQRDIEVEAFADIASWVSGLGSA